MNSALRSVWVVLAFELRRAVTLPRTLVMVALVVFPPAVAALVQQGRGEWSEKEQPPAKTSRRIEGSSQAAVDSRRESRDEPGSLMSWRVVQKETWTLIMFMLVPEVVCLLGLLLWATPVIHAEVDGKTWPYLALRPCGKTPILLGKYLAAVLWTAVAAWLGLFVSLLVAVPDRDAFRGVLSLTALVGLSSLAYGALFVLLGVLALRRGMIVAVAYTFVFEFIVSFIPAMVNRFTIQYHLRNLLAKWMLLADAPADVRRSPQFRQIVSDASSLQHILILLGMTAAFLTLASLVLRRRQLITAPEV